MADRDAIGRALARIPSGLFVLTAGSGEQATGMMASWVQQAGFAPPTVVVAVAKVRPIAELIRRERAFCITVLDDATQQLVAHFARGFAPGAPAFAGIASALASNGVRYPSGTVAHLACRLLGEAADWSDHTVFGGEVTGGFGRLDREPRVHRRKNGFSY